MDINVLMANLVFKRFEGFVGFGNLANRLSNPDLKYIRGFLIVYDNGYMSISGGGGASGADVSYFYLLDEKGNIIWQDSDTSF